MAPFSLPTHSIAFPAQRCPSLIELPCQHACPRAVPHHGSPSPTAGLPPQLEPSRSQAGTSPLGAAWLPFIPPGEEAAAVSQRPGSRWGPWALLTQCAPQTWGFPVWSKPMPSSQPPPQVPAGDLSQLGAQQLSTPHTSNQGSPQPRPGPVTGSCPPLPCPGHSSRLPRATAGLPKRAQGHPVLQAGRLRGSCWPHSKDALGRAC